MKRQDPYILLADDNLDDQSFIRDAFSYLNTGVELQIVDGGQEVLHYLKLKKDNELPGLIVLDYNMPEINGAEVLHFLNQEERYKSIPKIILSTSVYKKHIDYCLQIGAVGYLIKPSNFFDWKKLTHKLLDYLKK